MMNQISIITDMALQGKYLFLFLIYLIEGPIAGFISAMVSSTGQLNIYIVAFLLVSGEIGADIVYYFLGQKSSEKRINKKLRKYEDSKILTSIQNVLNQHPVRTLIFAKTVGNIAVPTILLIGRYKLLKFKNFLLWATIVCFLKDFLVLFFGYSLGISLESFLDGYDMYKFVGIIISLLVILYILYIANKDKTDQFIVKSLKNIK
jgi:membrane protein DedA with SNARE-associated domain